MDLPKKKEIEKSSTFPKKTVIYSQAHKHIN